MAKQKITFRVTRGALVPADDEAIEQLKAKGLKIGDVVQVDLTKHRNPRFHRLAHAIGRLCSENIDVFAGMDAHAVLKRLQLESSIECEESFIKSPDGTMFAMKSARSIAFEQMDGAEFRALIAGLCDYIATKYWPQLTPEQIENMADSMINL